MQGEFRFLAIQLSRFAYMGNEPRASDKTFHVEHFDGQWPNRRPRRMVRCSVPGIKSGD